MRFGYVGDRQGTMALQSEREEFDNEGFPRLSEHER